MSEPPPQPEERTAAVVVKRVEERVEAIVERILVVELSGSRKAETQPHRHTRTLIIQANSTEHNTQT